MAIEGLGSHALAGRSGAHVAQKAADFDQLGLRVTPDNVLGIYAAVAEEVARLRTSLARFRINYGDGMPVLGNGQPVSPLFSQSFNDSTAKLVALCKADVDDLDSVATKLRQAALAYGHTEDQLTAAFDPAHYRYTPAPIAEGPR